MPLPVQPPMLGKGPGRRVLCKARGGLHGPPFPGAGDTGRWALVGDELVSSRGRISYSPQPHGGHWGKTGCSPSPVGVSAAAKGERWYQAEGISLVQRGVAAGILLRPRRSAPGPSG